MATSLEILRPTPSHRTSFRPNPTDAIARELETRSISIYKAIARKDYSHPDVKRYLTSDFTSEYLSSTAPCMGVEVITVSANVDEDRGRASVWLLFRETDLKKNGLSGETVTILSWWKERGSWRCYKSSGMGGVSGFPQWFQI